jgi:hypothetical protein
MSDSSSGRNRMNSGSDSAVHYTGTAHQRYQATPQPGKASGTTGQLSNGYVGNGMRAPSNPKSVVKS